MKTRCVVFLVGLVLSRIACPAAVPSLLNFQGRVTVTNVPFSGSGQFKFALVNSDGSQTYLGNSADTTPADGVPDAAVGLSVSRGVYSVLLGDTGIANMAAIPATVFDNSDVRLRVWFNDGSHGFELLSPDQRVAAVGYALRAAVAEQVSGSITAAQLPANVPLKDASQSFGGLNNFNNPGNSFAGAGLGLTQIPSTSLIGPLTVASGQPYGIGHIADPGPSGFGAAFGVFVQDQYAYVANDQDGLRIYDISNPASPVGVGAAFDAGSAEFVVVTNTYAYVANYDDGLRIYDVSDPVAPVSVGHTNNGSFAWGLAVGGHYAYLANFSDGLRVYDVTDPANPKNVAHVNDGGNAYAVALSGSFAYLANDTDGLRIYNVTDPLHPGSVGHINDGVAGAEAFGVAVAGHYVYLANGKDGLRIYDVADPSNPVDISHIDPAVSAYSVNVVGNYAFVANDLDGLRIYDVTTPSSPVTVGHLKEAQGAAIMAVMANNRVFLANGTDGLRIYGLGVVRAGLKLGVGRDPASNTLEVEGTASKTTAGSWLANSDARIKTNVVPVISALDTLDRVRLVQFDYTDDYRAEHPSIEGHPYLNVVAQEFKSVFPDYVKKSGDRLPNGEQILQVDTWPLTIFSAAAIQELHRRTQDAQAELERRLQEKDRQIETLQERVSRLEQLLSPGTAESGRR